VILGASLFRWKVADGVLVDPGQAAIAVAPLGSRPKPSPVGNESPHKVEERLVSFTFARAVRVQRERQENVG